MRKKFIMVLSLVVWSLTGLFAEGISLSVSNCAGNTTLVKPKPLGILAIVNGVETRFAWDKVVKIRFDCTVKGTKSRPAKVTLVGETGEKDMAVKCFYYTDNHCDQFKGMEESNFFEVYLFNIKEIVVQ